MQASIRKFSILSLAIVFVTACWIGYHYRSYVTEHLIKDVAERSTLAVANTFSQAVWAPAAGTLQRPLCQQSGSPCPDLATVRGQGLSFFNILPLVAINVYGVDGQMILPIGGGLTNKDAQEEGKAAFITARGGSITSFLTSADFTDYGGSVHSGEVLRSFVPIVTRGNVTEVVEVIYDVSPVWGAPLYLQMVGTLIMLGVFGFLYFIFWLSTRRNEEIITTQHDVETDLLAAKAKAEADSQEKSKFLANVSHELRTPLNSIIGFSEILKDEVMGPHQVPQYKEYATDIYTSGTHLLSLINDILDFSKADASKLEVTLEDVDVTKLMLNCLRVVSPRAESASVELVPEMPEEHIVARTDSKRLKQVVLNLLSNSVKFTPPGGKIHLIAKLDQIEGQFKISVKDTGVGIAEKDISKVMAPFGQVENEYSSKSEGTGLGLPLSKKLVELMGGKFEIKSSLGTGTTVTLIFPYKPATTVQETAFPPIA